MKKDEVRAHYECYKCGFLWKSADYDPEDEYFYNGLRCPRCKSDDIDVEDDE